MPVFVALALTIVHAIVVPPRAAAVAVVVRTALLMASAPLVRLRAATAHPLTTSLAIALASPPFAM